MLIPEFWQMLGFIFAGLCAWCVVGLITAAFLGRMFGMNRWEDDV